MDITSAQCRAARAMIEWSRDVLAAESRVGKRTIVDFERGARSPQASTLLAIQRAFEESGGVEYLRDSVVGGVARVFMFSAEFGPVGPYESVGNEKEEYIERHVVHCGIDWCCQSSKHGEV